MRVKYEVYSALERMNAKTFPSGIVNKYEMAYPNTKSVNFYDFCKAIGMDSAKWKCTVYNKDGIAKIAASADVLEDGDRVIFGG